MEAIGISYSSELYTSELQSSPVTMSSNTSVTEPLQVSPPSRKGAMFESQRFQMPTSQYSSPYETRMNYHGVDIENSVQSAELKEKLIHAFRLNRKKQLTLERINKYNMKLMEELKTPRIKASNCALMVIDYTEQHRDPLIPEIWDSPEHNRFKQSVSMRSPQSATQLHKKLSNSQRSEKQRQKRGENGSGSCCTIM